MSATLDSIELGPGNGTYLGQAVVYHSGSGPGGECHGQTGLDTNFAKSVAGSGGLVAGSAAKASVTSNTITNAYLGDNLNVKAVSLAINANHTARFELADRLDTGRRLWG